MIHSSHPRRGLCNRKTPAMQRSLWRKWIQTLAWMEKGWEDERLSQLPPSATCSWLNTALPERLISCSGRLMAHWRRGDVDIVHGMSTNLFISIWRPLHRRRLLESLISRVRAAPTATATADHPKEAADPAQHDGDP